jgi:hypothetical protein
MRSRRPTLDELLKAVRLRKLNVIVVWSLDRTVASHQVGRDLSAKIGVGPQHNEEAATLNSCSTAVRSVTPKQSRESLLDKHHWAESRR